MDDNIEFFRTLCSENKQLIIYCTTDCADDYSIQYMGIKIIFPIESSFVKLKQFNGKTLLIKKYDFDLENNIIKVNKFEIL